MLKVTATALAAALMLGTAAPVVAGSEARIYPYATSHNYCPAGLRPVTINGVICCGTPNQSISYQSAKAHPAPRKAAHRVTRRTYSARASCPIGTKGCTFD